MQNMIGSGVEGVSENVLLIGGETPFMETLSKRMSLNDLQVSFTQSAQEALAIIQHKDIDVVILNMKDLEGEGIRILDSIKKIEPYTEVITLTTPNTIHWSIKGMKLGAFADLLIPFDNEDLVFKIRKAGIKSKAKKQKLRSLRGRIEDTMVSVTYAEAGEIDAARHFLKEAKEPKSNFKKEHKNDKL